MAGHHIVFFRGFHRLAVNRSAGGGIPSFALPDRQKLPLPVLEGSSLNVEHDIAPHGTFSFVRAGPDNLNDSFANEIADILRELISHITPVVDDLENEGGEGDEA